MKFLYLTLIFLSLGIGETFAQKIGVMNPQTLLDNLPSRKNEIAEIMAIEITAIKELEKMDSTLAVLTTESQKESFDPTVKTTIENQMRELQNKITERETEIGEELEKLSLEVNSKSKEIMNEASAIVVVRMKLDRVVESSQTMFSKNEVDITNDVLAEMLKIDQTNK